MFKNRKRLTASFLTILVFSTVFISLINLDYAFATVIFSDGFESGDTSAWGWTDGTPTVVNTVSHHGTYSLYCDASGDNVNYDVGSQTTVYVSFFWRTPTNLGNSEIQRFIRVLASDFSTEVSVGFQKDSGGNTEWWMESPSNGARSYETTISTNTWYHIVVRRSTGDGTGTASMYVNNVKILEFTNETQTVAAKYVTLGCPLNLPSAYYDCVTIADTYTGLYPYIEQTSDIDSTADVGTHSNFTAQQYGPDQVNDTLTEATTLYNSTLETQNFEGSWLPTGWTESPSTSAWNRDGSQKHGGTYSAGYEYAAGMTVGDLVSPAYNLTGAVSLYISFYYYDDDCDANELTYDYYDNTGTWDNIGDLASSTEDTFNNRINVKVTDSQYLHSAFQLRIDGATIGSGENFYVDDFTIIAEYNNYTLVLEEEFTEIPTGYNSTYLCVFAGNWTTTETLSVQGWCVGNSTWTTISSLTSNQWNNVSATNWVNSDNTTFYIRFIDGLQTADWTQSLWSIDTVYLVRNNTVTSSSYSFTLTETVTVGNSLGTQKTLSRTLTASITVNNALATRKAISKPLTESLIINSALATRKADNNVLLASITVGNSLATRKTLTDLLAATVTTTASLANTKGLNQLFTATVSVLSSLPTASRGLNFILTQSIGITDSLVKSFSLTRLLAETVSVAASLLNIKALTQLFTDSIAVTSVLDTAKTVTKTIIETLTGLVNIGDSLATQKTLTNRLAETVLVIADLSTVKSLITNLVEVLTGSISIGDSLVSQKGIFKTLTETLSVNSLLTTQKALIRLFTATLQPLAVLTNNMAVTKYITETLTGLIQPTATLTATKSLTMLLTESVNILSQITISIAENVQNIIIFLSERIIINESPQIGLTLAFAFLEFVDSVNISDSLLFEKPFTTAELIIAAVLVTAILVSVSVISLYSAMRKRDY